MKKFFDTVRPLFGGVLSQSQVDGLNTILQASERMPVNHRAYLLATALHETARTMQPITEYGGVKYFNKYDIGHLAAKLGNTPAADGDGYKYRGRGFVQITGLRNYALASRILKVDFVADPDKALVPKHAAAILVRGCSEGWFTGKALSNYLNSKISDYRSARRVVNGTDDAALIAGYARVFEAALMKDAGTTHTPPVGWAAWLLDLLRFWK